ncbi:hypothetical protein PFISCL1PPCAC_11834, partial [Pristionchus fissidentatus]
LLPLLLLPLVSTDDDGLPNRQNHKYTEERTGEACKKLGTTICTVFDISYNNLIKADDKDGAQFREDLRLFPTAYVFYKVNDDGLILDIPYVNHLVGNETRRACGWPKTTKNCKFWHNHFLLRLPGNKAEAIALLKSFTDMVVYVGSDHMVNYDYPEYAYNPDLLQLISGQKLPDIYKSGPFASAFTFAQHSAGIHNRDYLFKPYGSSGHNDDWIAAANGIGHWISTPGIYRYRLKKGTMNELFYDPNISGNKYLL